MNMQHAFATLTILACLSVTSTADLAHDAVYVIGPKTTRKTIRNKVFAGARPVVYIQDADKPLTLVIEDCIFDGTLWPVLARNRDVRLTFRRNYVRVAAGHQCQGIYIGSQSLYY